MATVTNQQKMVRGPAVLMMVLVVSMGSFCQRTRKSLRGDADGAKLWRRSMAARMDKGPWAPSGDFVNHFCTLVQSACVQLHLSTGRWVSIS